MESSLHSPEHAVLIDLLREQRQATGMRQTDLAKALGVQQSFISRYESGERRLDLVELRRICVALGTDLPNLVRELEHRLGLTKGRTRGTPTRS